MIKKLYLYRGWRIDSLSLKQQTELNPKLTRERESTHGADGSDNVGSRSECWLLFFSFRSFGQMKKIPLMDGRDKREGRRGKGRGWLLIYKNGWWVFFFVFVALLCLSLAMLSEISLAIAERVEVVKHSSFICLGHTSVLPHKFSGIAPLSYFNC